MPPPPAPAPRAPAAAARAAFFTLAALALPACLINTAAWFASEPHFLAQASPFRVQAAVCLAALVLFALALRRLRWAALFALFAAFNVWAVLRPAPASRPADLPASAAAPSAPALKILYANVLSSNPDPTPLLTLIAAERPDLVALLEINARWQAALTPALAADYPHRFVRSREDNFGLAVYSRQEPAAGRVEFFADVETPSFDFVIPRLDGDIRVLLTHPLPPGSPSTAALRDQHLADLVNWHRFVAGLAAPEAPSIPVLILGDFNATPWCPPLRRLLSATGLRLASADHALLPPATWPATVPFLGVPIDHALLNSRLACPSFRVGPAIGSDHRPLLLEVRVRP